jgi:pilus assembly protein Flp/PilA
MRKATEFLKRLGRDEEGTALIEYTILLGVIAVSVVATAVTVGAWIGPKWTALCNALPGAAALGTC